MNGKTVYMFLTQEGEVVDMTDDEAYFACSFAINGTIMQIDWIEIHRGRMEVLHTDCVTSSKPLTKVSDILECMDDFMHGHYVRITPEVAQ